MNEKDSKLVAKLRCPIYGIEFNRDGTTNDIHTPPPIIQSEAADAIERLSKDNERLREALKPFATAWLDFANEERTGEDIAMILSGTGLAGVHLHQAHFELSKGEAET
jgi:hypothetical protein